MRTVTQTTTERRKVRTESFATVLATMLALALLAGACGGAFAGEGSTPVHPSAPVATATPTTVDAGRPTPAYSFDNQVPAPPLRNTGRDFPAVYRSLIAYTRWIWAHRPDSTIVARVFEPWSPAIEALAETFVPVARRGARVAWSSWAVRSVRVVHEAEREVTLHVIESRGKSRVITEELGVELELPGSTHDEYVRLRADHDGRWRISARYSTPFEPERVQRPGEVWPDVSFDGSVPPPPAAGPGVGAADATRSLFEAVWWMLAHNPDATVAEQVFAADSPGFEPSEALFRRLREARQRFTAPVEIGKVTVVDDRDAYASVRVHLEVGAGRLVTAGGSLVTTTPPWEGDVTAVVNRDPGGYWRIDDLFAADPAQPDPDNPLRVP